MELKLHFFRKTSHSINVNSLISYFRSIEHTEIDFTDNHCLISYLNPYLDNLFYYKITQKSNIEDIYLIDSCFYNLNFFLAFDVIKNELFVTKILQQVKELCSLFELYIYIEITNTIEAFNYDNLYALWRSLRSKYLYQKTDELIYIEIGKLKKIINYQTNIFHSQGLLKTEEVLFMPYEILLDSKKNDYLAIRFDYEQSISIPANIDYVIIENNQKEFLIKYKDFLNQVKPYVSKIPSHICSGYYIKNKNLRKCKNIIKKEYLLPNSYEYIPLSKVIEL